ncbi:MAG: molybdopterin-dependent oxidoreductase [Gemmatimonas sp.]|nr:molybdopterin-dependent oxidoreductase [Gemmatimonas sp.]
MADYKLIGQSIAPQDLVAKVTGRAKYAEDFRAEGMLFAKLLASPMPHARVRAIDLSGALEVEGVVAVLTPEDLPEPEPGEEPLLTMEPRYEGQPILAVAAVDELTAAEAIERVRIDLEPLPFVLNPLDSLRPNGPDATLVGNVWMGEDEEERIGQLKWTEADFQGVGSDELPRGQHVDEWEWGENVDAVFERADMVLEETLYHQSQTHHPMEPRTSMAYWQNGRLYLHCSTQSVAVTRRSIAAQMDLDLADVVLISEYCGGGFGSKAGGSLIDIVPAMLSQKAGRPVMLRISRAEETSVGRARTGMLGWAKMGFRSDGRLLALDLFLVQDNGPFGRMGDSYSASGTASLNYSPESMRWRGVAVLTNTPPRSAQRAPGGAQAIAMIDPMMDRAARRLGIDRLQIRLINAPGQDGVYGSGRAPVTSSYAREALQRGNELFDWEERVQRSGQRNGSKVRGVGVALSNYAAGSIGYDGLGVIRPDGIFYIHQGIGNLGTHSVFDTARTAAELIDMPWERCQIIWGNTSNHAPHSSIQAGSQTTYAHTRANYALGEGVRARLQELVAADLGGSPEDYEVAGERVFRRGSPGTGMTFAQAAERAIELGGRFDGHELPDDIDAMTRASATALAGQGLVVAAKDTRPREGTTRAFVATFLEVDLDAETGVVDILDIVSVADCGTVLNPRGLIAQVNGGVIQGIGIAHSQKWAIDPTWGVHLAKGIEPSKPPTILDLPTTLTVEAVGLPDASNPIGAKGIGEAPVGAGAGALISAIEDAIGGQHPSHTPMTPDKVLNIIENDCLPCGRLETHL